MPTVHLTSAAQNPFTNNGVITGGSYGILADYLAGVTWTVTNNGTITSTYYSGAGVKLPDGTFTNHGTVIAQGAFGRGVFMSGSLVNAGVIEPGHGGIGAYVTGSVTNYGHIDGGFNATGIRLGRGSFATDPMIINTGTVTGKNAVEMVEGGNLLNGVDMAGASGYLLGGDGVLVDGTGAGTTIINHAVISGNNIYNPAASYGILAHGHITIDNGSGNDTTATIKSEYGVAIAVEINPNYFLKSATLNNNGTVQGGVIFESGSIFNVNLISGRTSAVDIYAGGTVTNLGTIKGGAIGVELGANAGDRFVNYAVVEGKSAVVFSGGTVTNYGSLYGGVTTTSPSYAGVVLNGGVWAGAPITAVLQNRGFIQGPTGVIANSGTVDNFGEIVGTYGPAIQFDGLNNRLIVEAGSSLGGIAQATADLSNVLELGSTPLHGGGLVTGLGTQLAGFETLDVDAQARWSLFGANTSASESIDLGAGSKLTVSGGLTDSGTLTIGQSGAGAGGTVAVTGYVEAVGGLILSGADTLSVGKGAMAQVGAGTGAVAGKVTIMRGALITGSGTIAAAVVDRGRIAANGLLMVTGVITGSGAVTVESGATLTVKGALDCGRAVFAGGGGSAETLALGAPAASTATIFGFRATDAIDLLGLVADGKSFSGGVLTLTEGGATVASLKLSGTFTSLNFALAGDGVGGTRITYVAGASTPSGGPGSGPAAFIGAIAALAPPPTEAAHLAAEPWRARGGTLTSPGHASPA